MSASQFHFHRCAVRRVKARADLSNIDINLGRKLRFQISETGNGKYEILKFGNGISIRH